MALNNLIPPSSKQLCLSYDNNSYITSVGVKAQQVQIVKDQEHPFYNAYHTYQKKGSVWSPSDVGLHMVSFSETPGNY